jgi:hypothetical protein
LVVRSQDQPHRALGYFINRLVNGLHALDTVQLPEHFNGVQDLPFERHPEVLQSPSGPPSVLQPPPQPTIICVRPPPAIVSIYTWFVTTFVHAPVSSGSCFHWAANRFIRYSFVPDIGSLLIREQPKLQGLLLATRQAYGGRD